MRLHCLILSVKSGEIGDEGGGENKELLSLCSSAPYPLVAAALA